MTVRAVARGIAIAGAAIAFSQIYVFPASSAETVGEANKVVNTVRGKLQATRRTLNTSDPVYESEEVSADADSRGELLLRDGSKVIVGEGSTIHMDDFVVAGDSFAEGTINVAKGAFRFISGNSKDKIRIKTPLSTIGIRGTALDVYVGEGGLTRVVLLNGQITTCSNGQCVNSNRPCDIVEVTAPGSIQELPFLRSAGRTRGNEAEQFDLTEQQQRHTREWRAPTIACSARAAEEAQTPGSTGNAPGANGNAPSGPSGRSGDSDSETGNSFSGGEE